MFRLPQSPSITGTSPLNSLVYYPGHSLGVGSYTSAEKQSICSTASADWASGVMANELNCNIIVNYLELQLRYYVYFQTNTLRKEMNPLFLLSFGLWSTIKVLQDWLFHWRFICHQTKKPNKSFLSINWVLGSILFLSNHVDSHVFWFQSTVDVLYIQIDIWQILNKDHSYLYFIKPIYFQTWKWGSCLMPIRLI